MSELPNGWARTSLRDIATFVTSGSRGWARYYADEGAAFVRVGNIKRGTIALDWDDMQRVNPPADGEGDRTRLQDDDVLITITADLGRVAVFRKGPDEAAYINQHVALVRPADGQWARYVAWYLAGDEGQSQLLERDKGTTKAGLGLEDINAVEVPFPPPAEQRRIVAKLDVLTARTARARADLDRVPALAARYKQAVLAKAFSGELTGSNGAGWMDSAISEIAEVGTGSTPKRSEAVYYEGGSIPWVTSSVVNRAYVDSADEFITEQALRETNCKVFHPGTLLVAMYGEGQTRGRVSVLGIAAATNQALAAISIASENVVRREYVYWFLRSQYLILRRAAAGGVQPNLNLGIIKATRIPVPPLKEQVEIVRLVEHAFREIDRMTAEAAAGRRLLDRLDQAVLAKAFRGKLVPQDPADEPASVLLDRIRSERAATPKTKRGRKAALA